MHGNESSGVLRALEFSLRSWPASGMPQQVWEFHKHVRAAEIISSSFLKMCDVAEQRPGIGRGGSRRTHPGTAAAVASTGPSSA